jgi:predicted secreted protein
MDQESYYRTEINKERTKLDLDFRALMKLIAPANEDQAIALYVSITVSAERQGRLTNELAREILNNEKVGA